MNLHGRNLLKEIDLTADEFRHLVSQLTALVKTRQRREAADGTGYPCSQALSPGSGGTG